VLFVKLPPIVCNESMNVKPVFATGSGTGFTEWITNQASDKKEYPESTRLFHLP
jgi:hypothetical protein